MTKLMVGTEWVEMRDNIRRAVLSLEVCWKCQRVAECSKHILGQTVLVWLCNGCQSQMEKPQPERPKGRNRSAAPHAPRTWEGFR